MKNMKSLKRLRENKVKERDKNRDVLDQLNILRPFLDYDIGHDMPRLARLDAPGVLHHVIIRGIERKTIFRDQTDQENFVDRLSQLVPATQTSCYAWVLMKNHAHFLFRSGPSGLAELMRRLLTGMWDVLKYLIPEK